MLKILCGLQKPTSGVVAIPNETTIGYLPQVMKLQDDTTVKQETRKAFAHNTEMKARLDKMQQEMADRTDYESESYAQLVEKFTQEHERYMMMGGENYEAEIERTLSGLGFTREDFDRPTREFSGGWRMRIELAKILLQKPDVLLLDEPTNHLDIESIQWLEQFLAQSAKAVVLVSHDRAFINNVTNRTLEITCGRVEDYKVKYDECLRSGDYPVICDEVRKDYGDHTVFDHVTLTIKRGEKVAFVGKNGEGKSTLVKCIMGEIPFTGNLKIGHNVQIGYFAQNQAQLLDENLTIFQTIDNVATGEMRLKVNDLLGAFMFGGETSEKYVKVLSGGERSRLAMIKLLLEPVNLLILDEPTNHLDMQSKDVLKEAIKAFDGTAIIVSHDREFLDGLVDKVYEFAGGKVREHLGGIYDYLRAHNAESISQALANQVGSQNMSSAGSPSSSSSSADSSEASSGKLSYAEHKEQQKKIRKAEKAVKECETKIEKLETRKAEIDALLMKPENATNMELVTEYTELMKSLDEENENWMMLSEELEEIKNS